MNLQLQKLTIRNFRNIISQTLDLSNLKKIKLVLSPSNGSGKSSLFYALTLCFFPQDKITTYADYIRFNQSKAEINLISLLDNERLNINLVISKTGLKRTISYKGIEYINDIAKDFLESLGFTELLSNSITFSSQSDDLINMTPSQRLKEMLSLDGSLDKLNVVIDNLKLKNKELDNNLSISKGQLLEISNQINTINNNILEIEKSTKENINIKEYQTFLDNFDNTLKKLNEEYLNINNQIDDNNIKLKINEKQNRLNDIDTKIKNLNAEKEIKYTPLKKSYLDIMDKINELSKNININNINKIDLQNLENKKQETINQVSILQVEINSLNSKLDIQKKGFCDVCGSKIPNNIAENTEKGIKEKQIKLNEIKGVLEDIQKQLIDKKEYNSKIDLYLNYKNKLDLVITETKMVKNTITTQIQNYEKDKQQIVLELEELNNELSKTQEEKQLKLKEELFKKKEEINILQNLKVSVLDYKKSLENLNNANTNKIETEKKLRDLENKIIINSKALGILSKDFQNYIVSFIISKFSNVFNVFIKKMFPYLNVSFRIVKNGLDLIFSLEEIDNSKIQTISSKGLSGAQKSIINIIYVILKAIVLKAPFILLDEVDEKMTDENSYKIIEMLSQEIFNINIFCISQHSRIFDENNNISNVSLIRVDNGEYTIKI